MTSESLSSRTLWLAQGLAQVIFLTSTLGWSVGCSKDASQTETQDVKEPTFDPSVLPAALRRRLGEAETRIKELEEQREVAQVRLDKLQALRERSGSATPESSAAVSQAKRQLKTLEGSVKRLESLVARIKLQAITAEGESTSSNADRELTTALQEAVEVYDELGELETTQREANLGQADAQFKLGRRYERGVGVDQSDAKALDWYVKAAEQDHIKAALAAGYFYRKGKGSAQDLKRAKRWYHRAAKLGNPTAAGNLARLLRDEGKVADSIRWYQIASDDGVSSAQVSLAKLYLSDDLKAELGPKSPQEPLERYIEARRLLRRASKSRRAKIRERAKAMLDAAVEHHAPKLSSAARDAMRWVKLPAGKLLMGDSAYSDSAPIHEVSLSAFSLSATEVTVRQYRQCVAAGACTKPKLDKSGCYYFMANRKDHPVNCVSWAQARTFAQWVGGELPSEAQWEYAARSAGRHARSPWGDAEATCQRVVMRGASTSEKETKLARSKKKRNTKKSRGEKGCGTGQAAKVCSRPEGMSLQGACDLVGNLWEWTLDEYLPSYAEAPIDGSARCGQAKCEGSESVMRVIRGGAYMSGAQSATSTKRSQSDRPAIGVGFRVAFTK